MFLDNCTQESTGGAAMEDETGGAAIEEFVGLK